MRSILQSHPGELARAIRSHRYDKTDTGIYVPGANVFVGGALKVRDYRDDSVEIAGNLMTDEGLTHLANVLLPPTGGYPQITQWYVAPFAGDYTPNAGLTAATFPVAATEFTAYTATTRLALTIAAAATTPSTGNTGNEALMVCNPAGGPFNVYGAAIVSVAAKSNTGGKLLAAVRMTNPKLAMDVGNKLGFEYIFTATDAG